VPVRTSPTTAGTSEPQMPSSQGDLIASEASVLMH
jgi:hypothetical protein